MSCCRPRWVAGLLLAFLCEVVGAETQVPWARAVPTPIDYQPQKVVYDVAVQDVEAFERLLDRVSLLNNLYAADPFQSSIVLVLHGNEIPFFAVKNFEKYRELMTRAQSLTVGETIEFRMCGAAARQRGLEAEDIHGFVIVVPMADAEIVRLQQEDGYAYMR